MAAKKRELDDEVKSLAIEIANLRCQVEMLAEAIQDKRLEVVGKDKSNEDSQ